jgi:hypothetical protein
MHVHLMLGTCAFAGESHARPARFKEHLVCPKGGRVANGLRPRPQQSCAPGPH